MSVPNNSEMAFLEEMIDAHGLREIVFALAVICGDKADHIAASYGGPSDPQARAWNKASKALIALTEKPAIDL